jgi:hypothetical protein
MSILTSRELEFLASLNTGWTRLYRNELARLLKENDVRCDARHEAPSIIPISAAHSRHSHRDSANATKT